MATLKHINSSKPVLLQVSKGKSKGDIIETFFKLCSKNSITISPQNVAILTRGKIHSDIISDAWKTPETELLAKASYLWHCSDRKEAYRICEKVLYVNYKSRKPRLSGRLSDSLGFLLFRIIFFVVCLTYGCRRSWILIRLTPADFAPLSISWWR